MDDWRGQASCRPPVPQSTFYADIWTDEYAHHDRPPAPNAKNLKWARAICRACPVRRECHLAAMEAEQGEGVSKRFGLTALMTPHQRASLEKRGPWPVCPRCGTAADPAQYLTGAWSCCGTKYPVAPLPDIGDEWFARHTQLSVTVVAWIKANVELGEGAPTAAHLAEELGVRINDLRRIYTALVEDGTLLDQGSQRPRYIRVGRLAASWQPVHLHVSPVV